MALISVAFLITQAASLQLDAHQRNAQLAAHPGCDGDCQHRIYRASGGLGNDRLRQAPQATVALQKCIEAAEADPAITVRSNDWYDTGVHVAAFDSTFGVQLPVFLRYQLPAVVVPPPVQVSSNSR